MRRERRGEYRITVVGGETIRAFVPAPLPPQPPIHFSPQRQRLLERATLALGRLDSITLLLPAPDIFLYAYVRREALLSSQIEGTQSSFSDLLLFELEEAPGLPLDEVVEVSNYVAALEHGIRRLDEGFPLCNRLIREMHAILLASGRGSHQAPGEFRRSQNWIGGRRPGDAHFVPPPPDEVEPAMAKLERFLNEGEHYPALVNAALAHVQFETIHPFLDGNGRMGRLLIAFVLYHDRLLSHPLLYLSLYFKQHRSEYYRLLDQVRAEGEWEAWLDFFLEGVERTAQNAVETAQRLVRLFEEDEAAVQQRLARPGSALRVLTALRERPLTTIKEVARRTGLTPATAGKGMRALESLGIVRETTGRKRGRIFAYERYLAILSEGAEPL
jgi:Fic family protein